ncbi:hypothetical protein [Corallibacter sp.]|uniref:hypothetical protein n=1 Tax=Corallibacter sp. TaxID=2038084 RepID=UPI003A90035F
MKYNLTIILLLLFLSVGIAQPKINELNTDDFMSIKIENVLFEKIKMTYGDIAEMETLFGKGKVNITNKEIGEETREFNYKNGLKISFGEFDLNYTKPSIYYLKTNNICIKNIDLNVGDSIEKLGNSILFNKQTDGDLSIMFTHNNGDCCPIIIEFDQKTKLITSIEYVVWT